MKSYLPKITRICIEDSIDSILNHIELIDIRLTYGLWENPRWLRNELQIERIKLKKMLDKYRAR